jgi:parallel beta-helix repeat protein
MCFYQQVNPASQKFSCFILALGIVLFFRSPGYGVTLPVPGEYKTIQEAIDKANPGDTVLVEPGTYTEVLSLKPGVIIKSRGSEKELSDLTAAARTIISSPGRQTAIVEGADDATINGFTLVDNESGYDPTAWRFGVLITGKSQTVTNCLISRLPYDAIGVIGLQSDSESYIYHNLISENRGNGIKCQAGARVRIVKNKIYENEQSGIENHKGVESHIEGNKIFKNGIDGVVNAGAKPFIKNNTIYGNGHNGIGLQKGSRGVIKKNKIYGNAQSGVGIRMNAKGTLRDNRIYRNMIGVGCRDLDEATIESNEIYENKRVGVGLQGCVGRPVTIVNNHIHDNQFVPIMPNPECNVIQSGNRF